MWRWSELLLNWVRMKIRRSSALRQLLIGMSTRRYFPASGTAGLARSLVRGKSRVPMPPPRITATMSCGRSAAQLPTLGLHRGAAVHAVPPAGLELPLAVAAERDRLAL